MKRVLIFLLIAVSLVLCACHEIPVEENYSDIQLFINEDYADTTEIDGEAVWWKKEAGVYAKEFFPKYEEIEYGYASIDFRIRSYRTTAFGDACFILKLGFDNAEEYEKAKADIQESHTFLEERVRDNDGIGFVIPVHEVREGDYIVKIVTNGKEKDKYPNHISAIAFNDKENEIRYLYIYESHDATVEAPTLQNEIKWMLKDN